MSGQAETADLKGSASGDTKRIMSPVAQRALAEAEARRAALDDKARALQAEAEVNGRGGPDPVRYDDWEVKGIASDF